MSTNPRETVRFMMFSSHDLASIMLSYRRLKGVDPTMVMIQPDFILQGDSAIVLRSKQGAGSSALATHHITPEEWIASETEHLLPTAQRETVKTRLNDAIKKRMAETSSKVPNQKAGRPKQGGGKCPHCQQGITDFNKLGFWYGWSIGVTPSYWDELRLYVFRRDQFVCNTCGSRRPTDKLNAHHIIAKEQGGTDSARNLMTLCVDCHQDWQPIMPPDEVIIAE
jgi:hypothetical protein